MGIELGRISGPLLSANLLRNGVDLAFEYDLLYLDVATGRIGIKTDGPGHALEIVGTTETTNLISDTADIANFNISDDTIQNVVNSIYITPDQLSDPTITGIKFATLNLKVSNQLIENGTVDSNIELSPTGKVQFNTSSINILGRNGNDGDLHATGDITFDGTIEFGNEPSDTVTFNSDINSSIIPDQTNTFDIGSPISKWRNLYSTNVSGTNLTSTSLTINSIDLLLTQGNTLYVSINGSDLYNGDHQHSTFRTIKHALSQASSGDTVIVFPGTYDEEFPLTVPQGVTIRGAGVRTVSIQPTAGTNTQDAFLLNGDTTVEFLTIQNFYAPGYAFKFAPGFLTSARSPYVYNVTVITKGSVVTSEDPLGFAAADAGGGAYLDGSVADSANTIPPTGLFFAATFITPNADAIVATNGVRIEWLNSFSYFANIGIYLLNGTAGRYNLATDFGAEFRSINSANIYGTYGIIADGDSTLAYVIGHNFGYIGSGASAANDPSTVIQANETTELNSGRIYYDSTDQQGDYRIGKIFHVEQSTGKINFFADAINLTAAGSIILEGDTSTTIVNALGIQVGNIRIHDNNIESYSGPVNFLAQSGTTTLNTDVYVIGSIDITGDVKVYGTLYLGNDPLDTITVAPNLTQDIVPDGPTLTLGTSSKRWDTLFAKLLDIDGITQIANNTISTLTTDTDLEFVAAGTGKIHVSTTDVEIDNDLTVDSTLTSNNLQTYNTTTAATFNTGNITISNNEINTTVTNADLRLLADTTGLINIDSNDVKIDHKLTVLTQFNSTDIDITGLVQQTGDYGLTGNKLQYGKTEVIGNASFLGTAQFYDFNIDNNTLQTTRLNSDVVLGASGSHTVHVKTTDVQIDNNLTVHNVLTVNGATSLQDVDITGDITLVGNYNQVGASNVYITGTFANNNLKVSGALSSLTLSELTFLGNKISVSTTNADLILNGNTTGGVVLDSKLKINDNTISNVWAGATTDTQKSVILSPNGTGNTVINNAHGLGLPQGNTSNRVLSSSGEIRYNTTTGAIDGYQHTGLVSFYGLYDGDRNTYVTAELTPGNNDNIIRFGTNGVVKGTISSTALATNTLHIDNVNISGNTIDNLTSADLEIVNQGTSSTVINSMPFKDDTITNTLSSAITLASTGTGYVKFAGKGAVVMPYGPTEDRRESPEIGEIRNNSSLGYMEVWNGTDWNPAIGTSGAAPLYVIEETMNLWSLILG